MSVFFGAKSARSWLPDPPIPPNSQVGVAGTSIGNAVPRDSESALRKVAVFGSVNLIAGMSSALPMDGFTGQSASKRQITLPPFFTDPDGSGQGMGDWIYQLVYSWLLRGNAIGRILDRDSFGRPSQIVLQHPDHCAVRESDTGPKWTINGKNVPTDEIWHRRAFPIPGRRLGLSPIALHAVTIGQGLAAGAFGLRWFTDGAHPSAILMNENVKSVSQEEATTVKAKFMSAVRGTREPVVMSGGWKYQPIQVSPEESQFLDTQRYSSAECARIFGPGVPEVLGYETGGSMTYANVEQRSIDLLKFSLDRWFTKIEHALSEDILANPRYVKINRSAMLATDMLTRWRVHEIALRNQVEVVNEVRDLEDLSPVGWGNEPVSGSPAPTTVKVEE